jgi:hypothetical protein
MKTNFSLLFYLKKQKNSINGTVPIYMRITVKGKRAEITTGRECEPAKWNAKAGKVIGTKEDVKILNAYLENMKAEVYAAHTLLSVDGTEITADSVKCKYLGKEEKNHTLLEAIKTHNIKMKALVDKEEYASETLRRFEVLERHVKNYLASQYSKTDLDVRCIDHEFIWIFTYRKKTDTRVAIPLLPIAASILDKYKNHPYCINNDRALPISSNQKMNEYLIEIAALSGINKTLGNRITKRTFGTTVPLLNGVPIESVSKMLGHTSIRTTQLYAKVLNTKVSEDMVPLMGKFVAQHTIDKVTESKIGTDIAVIRKKYATTPEMEEAL